MNFDMYQFDVLYQFLSPEPKFRPFVVGGLGFSHYGLQPINGQNVLDFNNRFAYNIGGGVKYFFNPHWGARLRPVGLPPILLRDNPSIAIHILRLLLRYGGQ